MRLWYFFVLRKLILQTRMHSHPVGLDISFLADFMCANSEGSGETARMRRLAWAFAGDKYHNLMSWLNWFSVVLLSRIFVLYT